MPTTGSILPGQLAPVDPARSLSSRAPLTPPGPVTAGQASATNRLFSNPLSSAATESREPHTYEHLSKTLSREELNPDNLRDSLRQLDAVAGITRSFEGTHRSYHSERGERQDLQQPRDSATGTLFSLTVTTRDGDEVEVVIHNQRGHDDTLGGYEETRISFEVSGDLDADEQRALTSLTAQLGGMADEFFKHDWAKLGTLDGFDEDELSGFRVNIGDHSPRPFEVDYQVDQQTGERRLNASQNGYEMTLSAQLDGLYIDDDLSNNTQYQQYRDLIASTALSYHDGEQSASRTAHFFQDGLDALFRVTSARADDSRESTGGSGRTGTADTGTADTDPVASQLHPRLSVNHAGLLQQFSSGLPDFSASFATPKLTPNPLKPDEVSMMTLSFSQTTDIIEQRAGQHRFTSLHQRSEYEARVRQFTGESEREAGPGGSGNYQYEDKRSQAAIDRSITFRDNRILAAAGEDRIFEQRLLQRQVIGGETEKEDVKRSDNNTREHYRVAHTPQEQQKALQQLEDYRTIEQLKHFMDGSQTSLFSHAEA